jgi:hypothetical protein
MRSATVERKRCEQDAQTTPADFDRLAPLYCWLEWFSFGPFLGQCRRAFLSEMQGRRTALIIGDGDGRFTTRLLKENSSIIVDAVDASGAMLDELERRTRPYALRLQTHRVDARRFLPQHTYDLVVTHFFLDCLSTDQVAHLAMRIRAHAAIGSIWVVSEFAVPDAGLVRAIARPLVSGLYWAFGWLTGLQVKRLPDHPAALTQAGFTLLQRRERLGGLLVSELWQAER